MKKLNVGCGHDKREGYVNIDCFKSLNPDVVVDLTKPPYPFKDNTFDYILARYVLEHMPKDKIFAVIDELYRISKPGAICNIWVPFYNCTQISGLNHYMGFNFNSFDFLEPGHKRNYYCKANMKVVSVKAIPTSRGKFIPFKKFLCHSIGELYGEMNFKLKVIKD